MSRICGQIIFILLVFVWLLFSCDVKSRRNKTHYIEEKLSFISLSEGNLLSNEWIRKPDNLWMLHETFKLFGYNRLYEQEIIDEDIIIFNDIYIERPILELLDSLLITYENPQIVSDYYNQFWKRRQAEANDSTVYKIAKEVNQALIYKSDASVFAPKSNRKLMNDTLLQLLEIELPSGLLTEQVALKHFDGLRKYGLHQSAYNLLHERYIYADLKWNKDSLVRELIVSETAQDSWIGDDTK